nr:hypothetical protein K4M19_00292 [Agrobacterium fabrum]
MISHTGKLNLSALIAIILSTAALPCAAEAATLRVGAAAENVATLDPTRATATVDVGVVSWMFNGLVRFPPGSADPTKIEPDLAEKWETTPDGLVWTFHLRNGVKFHGDYGTVTSEDVVYSPGACKESENVIFFERLHRSQIDRSDRPADREDHLEQPGSRLPGPDRKLPRRQYHQQKGS